ncbi:hypothetical protein [Brevundimonas sp.]
MIVMTTGMTGLMALMRQDERPVGRPLKAAASRTPALQSMIATTPRPPR